MNERKNEREGRRGGEEEGAKTRMPRDDIENE